MRVRHQDIRGGANALTRDVDREATGRNGRAQAPARVALGKQRPLRDTQKWSDGHTAIRYRYEAWISLLLLVDPGLQTLARFQGAMEVRDTAFLLTKLEYFGQRIDTHRLR